MFPLPIHDSPLVVYRGFEARLGACAAIASLAKVAPSALVPLLEPLVTEVQV